MLILLVIKPHRIAKKRGETNMKLILLLALILSAPAYAGEDPARHIEDAAVSDAGSDCRSYG